MKTLALTPLMLALLAAFSLPAAAQIVPISKIITQAELDAEKQKATKAENEKKQAEQREAEAQRKLSDLQKQFDAEKARKEGAGKQQDEKRQQLENALRDAEAKAAKASAEADKARAEFKKCQSAPSKAVEKVVTKEIPVTDPKTQKELRDAQTEIATLKKQLAAQSTAKVTPQPAPAPGPVIVPAPQAAPTNAPGQPGSSFKACTDCPEVVWLPQGNYLRGSPETEKERNNDEGPVRKVTIAYTLAAGKYPVTFNEWNACIEDKACKKPWKSNFNQGNRPVINVSYNMITKEYLPWLNQKAKATGKLPAGYQFALPSESEREYYARGITSANEPHPPFPALPGTRWADGRCPHTDAFNYNGEIFDYANCRSNTGVSRVGTLPVDKLPYPNRFGLFGVAGNVWELTRDCKYGNYNKTPDNGDSAQEKAGCDRVARGGSWNFIAENLRAAKRFNASSSFADYHFGFRVILTPKNLAT